MKGSFFVVLLRELTLLLPPTPPHPTHTLTHSHSSTQAHPYRDLQKKEREKKNFFKKRETKKKTRQLHHAHRLDVRVHQWNGRFSGVYRWGSAMGGRLSRGVHHDRGALRHLRGRVCVPHPEECSQPLFRLDVARPLRRAARSAAVSGHLARSFLRFLPRRGGHASVRLWVRGIPGLHCVELLLPADHDGHRVPSVAALRAWAQGVLLRLRALPKHLRADAHVDAGDYVSFVDFSVCGGVVRSLPSFIVIIFFIFFFGVLLVLCPSFLPACRPSFCPASSTTPH